MSDLHICMETILSAANKLEPHKTGGYLCIATSTGVPLYVHLFGQMEDDRAPISCEYSQEKARRLGSHPNHVLSWESRDPDNGKWEGAVRCGDLILSWSGHSGPLDEAMMIKLGTTFDLLMEVEVSVLIAASHNKSFRALEEKLAA